MALADNPDLEDLFAAFPDLKLEDVRACLADAGAVVSSKRTRATESPTPASSIFA